VRALSVGTDGEIFAGGSFTSAVGGPQLNRVGLWDGSTWRQLGEGADGDVRAIEFDLAGAVCIGGAFKLVDGAMSAHFARWGLPPECCRADFDANGTIEVADVFAFLAAWFGQEPSADVDGSGQVNVPDIFAFLSGWFAGCE
jgi:hypothetical protein